MKISIKSQELFPELSIEDRNNLRMQERLVELCIRSLDYCAETICENCEHWNCRDDCRLRSIADYLFAHNVIVLPCKIGDTCYCVWSNPISGELFCTEETVAGFVYDELNEEEVKIVPKTLSLILLYDLVNAFLTKEEAEKFKEELEKNNEEGGNGSD